MNDIRDSAQTDQYLTFTLAEETFAVEIVKVREVIDCVHLTRVPRMPAFLRGVINLRGSVVPVIDLRLILGMPSIEKTVDTCIIIAEVSIGDEALYLGMMADSVEEVINIDPAQIAPPPELGSMLHTDFIRWNGKARRAVFHHPQYRQGVVGRRNQHSGNGKVGLKSGHGMSIRLERV